MRCSIKTFSLKFIKLVVFREVSLMKSKSAEIKKDSLRVLDEAHLQCEKKIEMGETRAEKLVNRLRDECQMLQGEVFCQSR